MAHLYSSMDIQLHRRLYPPSPIALLNYDILEYIFEFFELDSKFDDLDDDEIDRRHLYWAALACKAFAEPALKVLWRSMKSIVPFLKLVPSHSLQVIEGVYTLTGNLEERDWNRLQFYASKVRSLTLDASDPDISSETLTRMFGFQLFRSMRRAGCTPVFSSTATRLISDTLEEFKLLHEKIKYPDKRDNVKSFLYFLHAKVPNLKRLVVHPPMDIDTLPPLLEFQHLHTLEFIARIDAEFLRQLMSLPNLTILGIDIHDTDLFDDEVIPFGGRIKKLNLSGADLMIASILRCLRGGHLNTISILFDGDLYEYLDEEPEEVTTMMSHSLEECLAVVEKQWSASLDTISLICDPPNELETSPNFYRSFSGLRYLREVSFDGWELSIQQYEQLLPCIPKVVRFLMPDIANPEDRTPNARPVSLDLLCILAQSCRDCRVFEVFLDGCVMPDWLTIPSVSHRLESLNIQSYDVVEPNSKHVFHVAEYIDRLFPHLENIGANCTGNTFWNHVSVVVKAMQNARREGRETFIAQGIQMW